MEAVIVATARRPIGRAIKGSLVAPRPDDLAAPSCAPCSTRCRTRPRQIEDVIMVCGQPAGEPGFNLARMTASSPGCDVPGDRNRYCSSSLQTIRMAAHAVKAGEGDVFIARASRP